MSHAPTGTLKRRHQNIRHTLAARSLDVLVVTSLPNVLYLTNFGGSAGIVVITADRAILVTDFRYATAIADMRGQPYECPDLETVLVDGSYDATLATLLATFRSAAVGFEASNLAVARHAWLAERLATGGPAPQLVATEGIVEAARRVKDSYELEVLAEAGRRLSNVAAQVLSSVERGQTEREVALAIDWTMRNAGFDRSAFETIVAGGPNAALPHARPTKRKLTEGDLVVLDFGGVYDSYCVDLTRTVSIGRASTRAREVHSAVLRAHDRAIAAVAPGVSRFAVDAAARHALGEAGMADAFGHGTGHGLGIEVHEEPRIVRRRPDTDARDELLAAGMVFTIEPGAYFAGFGGVRIEDDVAVTETGVQLLTHVTTDLLEL